MKKFFSITLGDLIGIVVAVAILFLTMVLVDKVDTIAIIEKYDLEVMLVSPAQQEGSAEFLQIETHLLGVSGKVLSTFNSEVNVQTEMQNQKLVLVPFVKPLAGNNRWIASPEIEVESDGTFTDFVRIGDEATVGHENVGGVDVHYKIHIVLVSAGHFSSGDELINLPKGTGKSNPIHVYRSK